MTAPASNLDPLRKRVEQFPDGELFRFSLGKALFDSGDFTGAIEHLDAALSKKPDWMLVAILLGRCWIKQGNRDKARHYLELGRKLAIEQKHDGPLEETTALLAELKKS